MKTGEIMKQMIEFLEGDLHGIGHFLKVHGYAKLIGELEGLEGDELMTLEIGAILHDIACPLCRKKYGNTNGKYQEEEGMVLAREFLKDTPIPEEMKERVIYRVGHHHTLTGIDGLDYQILIESDYLVNADEIGYPAENMKNMKENVFKTKTGIHLLESMYGV